MIQIQTKDQKHFMILEDKDAVEIISEYISDELAEYISDRLVTFDETEYRNAQEFASDYHAIEMENEGYRNELYDAKEILENLSYDLESGKRMSKKAVVEKLDKLTEHLQEIL